MKRLKVALLIVISVLSSCTPLVVVPIASLDAKSPAASVIYALPRTYLAITLSQEKFIYKPGLLTKTAASRGFPKASILAPEFAIKCAQDSPTQAIRYRLNPNFANISAALEPDDGKVYAASGSAAQLEQLRGLSDTPHFFQPPSQSSAISRSDSIEPVAVENAVKLNSAPDEVLNEQIAALSDLRAKSVELGYQSSTASSSDTIVEIGNQLRSRESEIVRLISGTLTNSVETFVTRVTPSNEELHVMIARFNVCSGLAMLVLPVQSDCLLNKRCADDMIGFHLKAAEDNLSIVESIEKARALAMQKEPEPKGFVFQYPVLANTYISQGNITGHVEQVSIRQIGPTLMLGKSDEFPAFAKPIFMQLDFKLPHK